MALCQRYAHWEGDPMPNIYDVKQYELSNGGIATCHSELKKNGVMHVCEIYGRFTARTFSGNVREAFKYETIIKQNLNNIYGENNIQVYR